MIGFLLPGPEIAPLGGHSVATRLFWENEVGFLLGITRFGFLGRQWQQR